MKKILTNNLGLKLLALLGAIVLWLVVVNVDDPVISRTYTGIPVEITNSSAITGEGKTYEILDESDNISVTVSAKRSVIDQMSKDYIRATANMKDLTFMNTVPIEIRTTRFSDRIDTLTARTKNLQVKVENLAKKQLEITVETTGNVNAGKVLGPIKTSVSIVSISGPESVVNSIVTARAEVDVTGINKDFSTTSAVYLYDANGDLVNNPMISSTVPEVHIEAQVLGTKEVPILGSVSGTPADGFGATGGIDCNPQKIMIAGSGSIFDEFAHVVIPDDRLSVSGARENVTTIINISDLLPDGLIFADSQFDGNVTATIHVEALQTKLVDVAVGNITIENVPEGYVAQLVDIGPSKQITVMGLANVLNQADFSSIRGTIDASNLVPRLNEGEELLEGMVHQGSNDGLVTFSCPSGITVSGQVYMEVILTQGGTSVGINDSQKPKKEQADTASLVVTTTDDKTDTDTALAAEGHDEPDEDDGDGADEDEDLSEEE